MSQSQRTYARRGREPRTWRNICIPLDLWAALDVRAAREGISTASFAAAILRGAIEAGRK